MLKAVTGHKGTQDCFKVFAEAGVILLCHGKPQGFVASVIAPPVERKAKKRNPN